jgi:hypothetical protein
MNLLYDNVKVQNTETLQGAAVATARHQHGLESCTVSGVSGNMLKNDKDVLNLFALNELVKKMFKSFHLTY